jgi:uncharacterized membrane protein YphA (DoxX/SURF4 family)
MARTTRFRAVLALLLLLMATPLVAYAHVKWFSDFSFADPPTSLSDALTPTFIALAALTFVVLGVLVLVDDRLKAVGWYQRITRWFEDRRHSALLIMRIGMGVTLLLSWQADTLLAPYLNITESWVGWLQFAIAGLLLFRATTPIAGLGVLLLYVIGVVEFGAFYMLDYFLFVGVGVYLLVSNISNDRIRGLRIPALYFAVGFSLFWVGLEKIIYPQWGLYILQQNPQLTLGLDTRFFLTAAAFVELALGYLLIIGLLERPIALAVTLVFFMTTLVFGKTEVIGHTIIHAALLVFLLEGPGRVYPAPINIHRRLWLRVAFASVNFILLLALLIIPYSYVAQLQFEQAQQTTLTMGEK